jgi:hypothetical protein
VESPCFAVLDEARRAVLAERMVNGGQACCWEGRDGERAAGFIVRQLEVMTAEPVYRWVTPAVLAAASQDTVSLELSRVLDERWARSPSAEALVLAD